MFEADIRLLGYIRRVNLDIMWSKEPLTVGNTLRLLEKGKKMSAELGLPPVSITVGPWPVQDKCGFQVAIEILRASQMPGKNSSAYSQFDSIRKIRSAYLTAFEASPERCLENACLKSEKGQISTLLNSETQSKLFYMFMQGCEKRMGRLVKQDIGMSGGMMKAMLEIYENEIRSEDVSRERKRFIIVCASAFAILFTGALRGGEVFMIEASELVRRRDDGRDLGENGHVVVPLMGRFKNETGERNLVLVLANKTKSGIAVRRWVDRFTALLLGEGRGGTTGPALCDEEGFMLERWKLNAEYHAVMQKIQSSSDTLIAKDIEVDKKFNVYRSFRRGATTQAKEQGVSEATIAMNNRWRKVQLKQGGLPKLPMSQLYVEMSQALTSKLRFSKSL
jgi:hypothetical protein